MFWGRGGEGGGEKTEKNYVKQQEFSVWLAFFKMLSTLMLLAFFLSWLFILTIRRANKNVSLNFDKLEEIKLPCKFLIGQLMNSIDSLNKQNTGCIYWTMFYFPTLPEYHL